MWNFNNKKQDEFVADFGFTSPHKTKAECKNPVFADHQLHRIAIMKDYHIGSKGDVDEGGMPGWVSKFVCTGCGKRYKVKVDPRDIGITGYFHPDPTFTVSKKPVCEGV
jgi:hypothetical protein